MASVGSIRSGKHKKRVPGSELEQARQAGPPITEDASAEIPVAPSWLVGPALLMYEGLARQLIRPHMLVDVDQTALTMFAEALTIYAQVAAQMNEDVPPKYVLPGMHMEVVRNPLVQVRMQAWDRVMKSCVEFGITPSSRSRALMGGIAKQVLDEPADMDDAKFFRKPRVVK